MRCRCSISSGNRRGAAHQLIEALEPRRLLDGAAPAVALQVSDGPFIAGEAITVTATVTNAPPAGSRVSFLLDGVLRQYGALDDSGVATATIRPDAGAYRVSARLEGSGAPDSNTVLVEVQRFQPSITLQLHEAPQASILSVPELNDMVFDDARQLLLITTGSGCVLRYDVRAEEYLAPFEVGTDLRGADITADGKFLYVAEGVGANGQGIIHKVNLDNGAVTNLTYPLVQGETGAADVVLTAAGVGLLTGRSDQTQYINEVGLPARSFDMASGIVRTESWTSGGYALETVANSGLTRSADGNWVAMHVLGNGYATAVLDVQQWQLVPGPGSTNYPYLSSLPSFSADGSLIMRHAFAATLERRSTGEVLTREGNSAYAGVAFHPVTGDLYSVSSGGLISVQSLANVRERTGLLSLPAGLQPRSINARMMFSDDGQYLFVQGDSGAAVVNLSPGPVPARREESLNVQFAFTAGQIAPTAGVQFVNADTGEVLAEFPDHRLGEGKVELWVGANWPGRLRLIALHAGDLNYRNAASAPLELEIGPALTRMEIDTPGSGLVSRPDGSLVLRVIKCGDRPPGTVSFYDGPSLVGSADLVGGIATLNLGSTPLALGNHALHAVYSGAEGIAPCTSAPFTLRIEAQPGLSLVSTSLQVASGNPVTFTARVTSFRATDALPTGAVSFSAGGRILGAADLVDGTAVLTVADLPPGVSEVKAFYDGRAGYADATATLAQTVLHPLTLDLMVLYTAQAAAAAGGAAKAREQIDRAVSDANQVLANNRMEFSFRLVHVAEVAYVESTLLGTDLDRLADPLDHYIDEIHLWRDQYQADLVSLMVCDGTDWAGIAIFSDDMADPDNDAYAFSVVTLADAGAPNYTLVHELGHNLGANHDEILGEGPGIFPDAYAYCNGWNGQYWQHLQYWQDVMSYGPSTVLPYFSDPNVTDNGRGIGSVNQANNARAVREMAPRVAAYRGPAPAGVRAATFIDLAASNAVSRSGAPLTLTATVRFAQPNGAAPQGTVSFWINRYRYRDVPVDAQGVARIVTSEILPGNYRLTAVYEGSSTCLAAASRPLEQQIIQNIQPLGSAKRANGVIKGYALDRDTPGRTLRIKVVIDGREYKPFLARQRVKEGPAWVRRQARSFEWKVPALKSGRHSITIYAMDSESGQWVQIGTMQFRTSARRRSASAGRR